MHGSIPSSARTNLAVGDRRGQYCDCGPAAALRRTLASGITNLARNCRKLHRNADVDSGIRQRHPARVFCHLTCYKRRTAPATARTNCRQIHQWGAGTVAGARAITAALLYVGAAIEASTRRQADDTDALAAMLDDRLTSIEATIDAARATPVPLWRRMTARRRRSEE
jgi:hypothetical protein